jgi:gamma-D-glutamyl-L-lysine dipeptidyl-peptidase
MRARYLLLLLPVFAGCATTEPATFTPATVATPPGSALTVPAAVTDAVAAARRTAAPDRRLARFDVEAVRRGDVLVLRGETDQADDLGRLRATLAGQAVAFVDSVRILPDPALGHRGWGIVAVSVANLRTTPTHSGELTTQALLGTPLRILKQERGWWLVQTPDRYIAWVDGGGFERVAEGEVQRLAAAPKVIVTNAFTAARSEGGAMLADLVAGNVLETTGETSDAYRVRTPDGRDGLVLKADAEPYDRWLADLRTDPAALVETARTMLGVPYLWGGTSTKGVDCSGFTKTIYLLHGLILPRDANQQALAGEHVDEAGDFSKLQPGDLLFFGTKALNGQAERIVHVGMWIGGGEFIHASGRVRINSMDPTAPHYDAFERGRYVRARRYMGTPQGVALLREGGLYARPGSE